jgi:hypothetical protein
MSWCDHLEQDSHGTDFANGSRIIRLNYLSTAWLGIAGTASRLTVLCKINESQIIHVLMSPAAWRRICGSALWLQQYGKRMTCRRAWCESWYCVAGTVSPLPASYKTSESQHIRHYIKFVFHFSVFNRQVHVCIASEDQAKTKKNQTRKSNNCTSTNHSGLEHQWHLREDQEGETVTFLFEFSSIHDCILHICQRLEVTGAVFSCFILPVVKRKDQIIFTFF